MRDSFFWEVALVVLALGSLAYKSMPDNVRVVKRSVPLEAVMVKDEAMEELEKANKLNNLPGKKLF